MITVLFIAICIIFIGLGLPDSLLGSAWPAIYSGLDLPISYANFITFLISLGTVTASFFSARLINKFGTGILTAVSTLLSAICVLGFSFSNSMIFFCLISLPLGFGAGAIDAALNNFVAVHYSSLHMSLLHCFYGVGVSLSPFLMALALGPNNNWRGGYRLVFLIMVAITIVSFAVLPIWKKITHEKIKDKSFTPITLSLKQMIKMPAVRTSFIMFFSTVALEFTCGIWACTYLVNTLGFTETLASSYLTFYYVGITVGRFSSGFISKLIKVKNLVFYGYTIVGIALLLLILPLPAFCKAIALLLVGFGNGPTFPNLIYLTPINFGKVISQSIIGLQMTACNLGILIIPPVFGFMAEWFGLNLFPYFLSMWFIIMVVSTLIYYKRTKPLLPKQNSNTP